MGRPPLNRKCETPGCDRRHKAKGGCGVHYVRPGQLAGCGWRRRCDRRVFAGGLCTMHYLRRRRGHRMDGPPQKRRWTEDEDRRIIDELRTKPWGKRDWVAAGRQLDRTPSACQSRVWVLRQRDRQLLIETG